MIPTKLKSNKGIFLALIVYPILFLLFAFNALTYMRSLNENNLEKIHLNMIQAQYEALRGIEYATVEYRARFWGNEILVTHTIDGSNSFVPVGLHFGITPILPGTSIGMASDGSLRNYLLKNGNNGFEARFYWRKIGPGNHFTKYILSRGIYNGQTRLFVKRFAYPSLYDKFIFTTGNLSLGPVETLIGNSGEIFVNGDLKLNEWTDIQAVLKLETVGKIHLAMTPNVKSAEENIYPVLRYPAVLPYAYTDADPPPDINPLPTGDGQGDNNIGIYRNQTDSHYAGDFAVNGQNEIFYSSGATYSFWRGSYTPSGGSNNSPTPISPTDVPGSPVPGEASIPGPPRPAAGKIWGALPVIYNLYEQTNYNCFGIGSCANGATNNSNYFTSHPKINGWFIPNRLPGNNTYSIPQYIGDSTTMMTANITNSEMQQSAWDNFINSAYNADPLTSLRKDLAQGSGVYAGARNGVTPQTKSPDMQKLIHEAKDAKKGMSIVKSGSNIIITINDPANGGNQATIPEVASPYTTPYNWVGGGCGVVLREFNFINAESGLPNKVIELDMANMIACDTATPGLMLPKNGLIYSEYSLAIKNASQLPFKGLTYIVKGNLYLEGNYNTAANWQPSSAIVSNQSYLLSDTFDFPAQLPHTGHHAEYPNKGNYDSDPDTLKAGVSTLTINHDYTSSGNGYNWQFHHENQMPHKVPGGAVYNYNIALVGQNAWNPRTLERWSYYSTPGTDSAPPTGWTDRMTTVKGAFIQLGNEFPPVGVLDKPNYRFCNQTTAYPTESQRRILFTNLAQTIPFNNTNYPCRNTSGPAADLLFNNIRETKEYDDNFVGPFRPPDDIFAFKQDALIELEPTSTNWNKLHSFFY